MAEASACRWCGEEHGPRCPWVKAQEFDIYGNVTRIEFLTPADCAPARPQAETPPEDDYPKLKPMKGA